MSDGVTNTGEIGASPRHLVNNDTWLSGGVLFSGVVAGGINNAGTFSEGPRWRQVGCTSTMRPLGWPVSFPSAFDLAARFLLLRKDDLFVVPTS